MNIGLREASSADIGGEQRIGSENSDARHGLQRLVHGASRRLATRRANIMVEQETERLWFWRLVKLEVERARRHDGVFTVLCVQHTETRTLTEEAHQLRPQLRGTDAVVIEQDRILILLGETSGDEARHVARRLAEHSDRLPGDSRWNEVEFPRHALTLGALIECLLHPDTGERLLLTG